MKGLITDEIKRYTTNNEPVNILEMQAYLKSKGLKIGRYALEQKCKMQKAQFI